MIFILVFIVVSLMWSPVLGLLVVIPTMLLEAKVYGLLSDVFMTTIPRSQRDVRLAQWIKRPLPETDWTDPNWVGEIYVFEEMLTDVGVRSYKFLREDWLGGGMTPEEYKSRLDHIVKFHSRQVPHL